MKGIFDFIFKVQKGDNKEFNAVAIPNEESFAKTSFLKLKDEFLSYQDVCKKSVQTYDGALKQFYLFMVQNNINNPEREDIIKWREELRIDHKPTTVNAYLIAVRNFFKYLEYKGIYKNITENIKGIKLENQHLKRGFTIEELKRIIENCPSDREKLIAHVAFSCALRANEVVNIRLEDFYEDNGVIMLKVLGKGRGGLKQESVKIDDRLFEMIKEHIKKYEIKDYLFESKRTKSKLDTKVLREKFREVFVKAGIKDLEKVSFHSFRHSSVTISLDLGMSIQEVSESARHKNISTTMIYKDELDRRNSVFSNKLCDALFMEVE